MSNLKYWLWLSALRGVGTGKKLELLDQLLTPEGICYGEDEELARAGADRRTIDAIRGTSLEEADRIMGECQRLGLRVLTIQDTEDLRQADLRRGVILIGSEGRGLSAAALAACGRTVKIPMSGRCESLNAAVAAAVLLWEGYR